MARLRDRSRLDPNRLAGMTMELLIGPTRGFGPTVDDLGVAWALRADDIMSVHDGRAGTRPWAYWAFDLDEAKPSGWDAEAVRLAELGLLGRGELAALRERANEARLRMGTDKERISGGGNRASGVPAASRTWSSG
jgi:hypothetical protein